MLINKKHTTYRDMVLSEYAKGNIVFIGIDGAMSCPINDFIRQPAQDILYDLNRSKEVVLTFIEDQKWVNDYAVATVIELLKEKLDEAELNIKALKEINNNMSNEINGNGIEDETI